MEFIELTIRIPVLRFSSLRFRVKSLLLLMVLVALCCVAWKLHRQERHARLVQQIKAMQSSKNMALQNWKLAAVRFANAKFEDQQKEMACRAEYFKQRDAMNKALKQLADYQAVPGY